MEAESTEYKQIKKDKFEFYCFDLSKLNRLSRLLFLSTGYMLCSLFFSIIQERVFRIPGFKFGGYMTIVTSITYVLCGALEMVITKNYRSNSGLANYFILAVTTFCGMYFTNWSLQYISFPVRIIFKSSKLIPVMIVSILLGKSLPRRQFINNCALVIGLIFFIYGDIKSSSSTKNSIFGILLISLGIFSDAMTSNFEEHVLIKKHKVHRSIIICITNLISLLYSLPLAIVTGELSAATGHTKEHPETIFLIIAYSFVNYFSVSFVLMILEQFGSTESEVAKTARKFLSVVLSFIVFTKPISHLHVIGGSLFFSSLVFGLLEKRQKKSRFIADSETKEK